MTIENNYSFLATKCLSRFCVIFESAAQKLTKKHDVLGTDKQFIQGSHVSGTRGCSPIYNFITNRKLLNAKLV